MASYERSPRSVPSLPGPAWLRALDADEEMRHFLDRIRAVVTQTDADLRIVYVNSSIRRVTGFEPEEIASLLIPEFVHFFKPENRQNLYWGRNALKLNAEYFGIAVVFFAAVAIAGARRDPRVLPLALLILVTLTFSLGPHTPVFRFFYDYVPGMNVLRTPGMIAFLFAFPAVTWSEAPSESEWRVRHNSRPFPTQRRALTNKLS